MLKTQLIYTHIYTDVQDTHTHTHTYIYIYIYINDTYSHRYLHRHTKLYTHNKATKIKQNNNHATNKAFITCWLWIYIYIYIYTHTHTPIYIYIYMFENFFYLIIFSRVISLLWSHFFLLYPTLHFNNNFSDTFYHTTVSFNSGNNGTHSI